MRKVLWIVMLLLLAGNGWAQTQRDVDRFTGGIWWNANQSGHGFTIEVISETLTVIYWYVYHPDGTPTFLIAVGPSIGNKVVATAYYYSGMKFGDFNPLDNNIQIWGTLTLEFHDCHRATLDYTSPLVHNGVPYGTGTIQLDKNLPTDGMQCADKPNAGIYLGNFQSAVTGDLFPGRAVLSPDGGFAVYGIDAMIGTGTWAATGTDFSGFGRAVNADPNASSFAEGISMLGKIMPEYKVEGDYEILNGDFGTFDFYSAPSLYRRGISLQAISGNYKLEDLVWGGAGTGVASLLPDGYLSGTDSNGCDYDGQLTLPDSNFNLFKVSFDLTGCGTHDGQYTGYGAQTDVDNLGDGRGLSLVATHANMPWSRALDLSLGGEPDQYEPDVPLATPISSGVPQTRSIFPAGDLDWVTIFLSQESQVVFETSGPLPSDDTELTLLDGSVVQIDYDDDISYPTNRFSRIDRSVCGVDTLPAGRYFARVNEYDNDGEDEIIQYNITVTITPCP